MKQKQPMQTNPQEEFMQIPLKIEPNSATLINSKQRNNKWATIIICILLVFIGQSNSKLLENFYYGQIKKSHNDNKHNVTWTRSLLQFIGFPLLILPYFLIISSKNQNKLPIKSDRKDLSAFVIFYICTGILMVMQAKASATAKLEIPFHIFIPIYTTHILYTPIFFHKVLGIKYNPWMITSLFFALLAGALTFNTSFAGEPNGDEMNHELGIICTITAAGTFSYLLFMIQLIFDIIITERDKLTNKNPNFAMVLEILIFSDLVATVISLIGLLMSSEKQDLKREMDLFPSGKIVYVTIMVCEAIAWQIYWVGIVGLVFAVSSVFSSVINVCIWPIVSVLVILFFNNGNEFDALIAAALAAAAISTAAYFYMVYEENNDSES